MDLSASQACSAPHGGGTGGRHAQRRADNHGLKAALRSPRCKTALFSRLAIRRQEVRHVVVPRLLLHLRALRRVRGAELGRRVDGRHDVREGRALALRGAAGAPLPRRRQLPAARRLVQHELRQHLVLVQQRLQQRLPAVRIQHQRLGEHLLRRLLPGAKHHPHRPVPTCTPRLRRRRRRPGYLPDRRLVRVLLLEVRHELPVLLLPLLDVLLLHLLHVLRLALHKDVARGGQEHSHEAQAEDAVEEVEVRAGLGA